MKRVQKITKIVRRLVAISLALILIIFLCLAYRSSFKELRVESAKSSAFTTDPKTYHLVLDSIDEAAGKLHARAEITLNRRGFLETEETNGKLVSLDGLTISFGPFFLEDLGQKYERGGIPASQDAITTATVIDRMLILEVEIADREKKPTPQLTPDLPKAVQQELTTVGDPRLYPFDRYLVLGKVSCEAFANIDKTSPRVRVLGDIYHVELRVPEFTLRDASDEELEKSQKYERVSKASMEASLPKSGPFRDAMLADYNQVYNQQLWQPGTFAFVLERPLFLKLFAGFLGGVALLSVAYVAFGTEPKQIVVNAVGTFLGLWAVRQALSVDAPKTATLVDYATLVLYSLLVVIVLVRLLWGFHEAKNIA